MSLQDPKACSIMKLLHMNDSMYEVGKARGGQEKNPKAPGYDYQRNSRG